MLGAGRVDLSRTALHGGYFSNFFDLQARALAHGRLSVPTGSLGIEGFVVDGRTYMYFPPFPALLRMPITALTDAFDGRLTAVSMLVAWVVTTAALASLLVRIRLLGRGSVVVGWGEAIAAGAVLCGLSGGSVLVFLASLPWVYHEVYAWAIATVLGALACLVALLDRPTRWRAAGLGLCTVAAVLTRSPGGWACVVGCLLASHRLFRHRRELAATARPSGSEVRLVNWSTPAVLGLVALAVGVAVNLAKFGNPLTFTLDTQIWTQLNGHRQQALQVNDGSLIGPQFFRTSLYNYFRPDGIRFRSIFPFITLPGAPPPAVQSVFLDQTYRTGSVTAFAPWSLVLLAWGAVAAFRRQPIGRLGLLRIPLVTAASMTVGVMFYGYLAHRYTAEFFPVLALGTLIAVVDLVERMRRASRPARAALVGPVVLLGLFGMAANLATAVTMQATTAGGDALREFVTTQLRFAGSRAATTVDRTDRLPRASRADHLVVVGDCRALVYGTGETYEPWIMVDATGLRRVIAFEPEAYAQETTSTVVSFDGDPVRLLSVDTDGFGSFRLRLSGGAGQIGPWRTISSATEVTVTVSTDDANQWYLLDASTGDSFQFAVSTWNSEWFNSVSVLSEQLPGSSTIRLVDDELLPAATCRRADRATRTG